MKYIANIITKGKFKNNGLFHVVNDIKNIDETIPSLIIGWEFTKELFPNVSIIDWKINDNFYWTFGKREKRDKQELDISKFTKLCINRLIKKIEYKYSNVLIETKDEKEELFKSITSSNPKTVFLDGNMMYFYEEGAKCVNGLLLSDIEYEGRNRNAILAKLHSSNGTFLNGIESGITFEIRDALKDNKYIIPYMYS